MQKGEIIAIILEKVEIIAITLEKVEIIAIILKKAEIIITNKDVQYIGDYSLHRRYDISTVGDNFSTVEVAQYSGG